MTQDQLLKTLMDLELSQYFTAFSENDVDYSTFLMLSGDDLKDLGVTSLGHRKKLSAKIAELAGGPAPQAAAPAPAPAPTAKPASNEEKVFLEDTIMGADRYTGGLLRVRITSHRAILGSKTYSLSNIAAVSTTSDRVTTDSLNDAIEKRNQVATAKASSQKLQKVVGGIGLALLGLAMIINGDPVVGAVFLMGGLFVLLMPLKGPELEDLLDYSYSVQIEGGGTSSNVLWSRSNQKIQKIAEAINNAIVNTTV